jgi:DNA-binding XRE family transcriptional regulator
MNGQDMRRARGRLGLTQAGLGEALGLHENTVARAERDEIPIPKVTELAIKYLLLVSTQRKGEKERK